MIAREEEQGQHRLHRLHRRIPGEGEGESGRTDDSDGDDDYDRQGSPDLSRPPEKIQIASRVPVLPYLVLAPASPVRRLSHGYAAVDPVKREQFEKSLGLISAMDSELMKQWLRCRASEESITSMEEETKRLQEQQNSMACASPVVSTASMDEEDKEVEEAEELRGIKMKTVD